MRREGIGRAYVVPELPLRGPELTAPGVEVVALGDHLMMHGARDIAMFQKAELAAKQVRDVSARECGSALHHKGIDLVELAETALVSSHLYPTLVVYDVLEELLKREPWAGVLVIRTNGRCADALEILRSQSRPETWRSVAASLEIRIRSRVRSAYDSIAPGWIDQIVIDNRYRMRDRRKATGDLQRHTESYLFVTSDVQPICWTTAVPVMRELAQRAQVIVLTDSAFQHQREVLEGVELRTFAQVLTASRLVELGKESRLVARRWLALADALTAAPPHGWSNERYAHAVRMLMRPVARLLERELLWLHGIDACCERWQPRALCVIPDFAPVTMAAMEIARPRGIPSITIQNGLRLDNARTPRVRADFAAVHEDWTRRLFLERSAHEPTRIIATGQPRWDESFKPKQDETERTARVMRSLGLPDNARYAVYLTQPLSMEVQERVLAGLANASDGMRGAQLVIKTHPRERTQGYQEIVGKLEWRGPRPIVIGRIDLHDLLRRAQLAITCFSTAAMEAALLDVPVLLVDLTGARLRTVFADEGLAVEAHDQATLARHIQDLFCDSDLRRDLERSRKSFLRENPQLTDGGAARRVARLMSTARTKLGTTSSPASPT